MEHNLTKKLHSDVSHSNYTGFELAVKILQIVLLLLPILHFWVANIDKTTTLTSKFKYDYIWLAQKCIYRYNHPNPIGIFIYCLLAMGTVIAIDETTSYCYLCIRIW